MAGEVKRFRNIAFGQQQGDQGADGLEQIRLVDEGAPIGRAGLVPLAELLQRVAEIVVRVGVVRLERKHLAQVSPTASSSLPFA